MKMTVIILFPFYFHFFFHEVWKIQCEFDFDAYLHHWLTQLNSKEEEVCATNTAVYSREVKNKISDYILKKKPKQKTMSQKTETLKKYTTVLMFTVKEQSHPRLSN